MKITPQDIIDKEFKVKFRGFDMAEVDAFLEEVAESFFKLTEENTILHEKLLALQQELETGAHLAPQQGQIEIPAELGNLLEDLKQDTATIGAELVALKQDRQTFGSLEKNLKSTVTSLHDLAAEMKPQGQVEFPADIVTALKKFQQDSAAVAAELAALKAERQAFESLKKNLEAVIGSAREAASLMAPKKGQAEIPSDLAKTLADFKQASETLGPELAALKVEFAAIAGIREDIKQEVQAMLSSHFEKFEAKLSLFHDSALQAAPKPGVASQLPPKKEKLLAAEIIEEPEGHEDEPSLPDYRAEDDGDSDGGELEFLTEDDILDVDKLRGIFQSVLDEGISDAHDSRDGDDATADLLFLEDAFIEDDHEPEVTFSLDEQQTPQKSKFRKP